MPDHSHHLIVTIVKKGWSERIIKASKAAGAEGATILYGRGTGINEQKKLLGICIEPEKEIILTVIPHEKSEEVLASIVKAGNLDKEATGISFVIEVSKVVGVVHLLNALGGVSDQATKGK